MNLLRIILHSVFLIVALSVGGCSKVKYVPGRDTVDSFGDGRYEILRLSGNNEVLMDMQTQETIAMGVVSWKDTGGFVVVLGSDSNRFVTVDYPRAIVSTYETLEQVPLPVRADFESLLKK